MNLLKDGSKGKTAGKMPLQVFLRAVRAQNAEGRPRPPKSGLSFFRSFFPESLCAKRFPSHARAKSFPVSRAFLFSPRFHYTSSRPPLANTPAKKIFVSNICTLWIHR